MRPPNCERIANKQLELSGSEEVTTFVPDCGVYEEPGQKGSQIVGSATITDTTSRFSDPARLIGCAEANSWTSSKV